MKKRTSFVFFLSLVCISALVIVNSCKKDDVNENRTQTDILYQNDDFTENILSFIDRCKTLTENPGIRSDDFIQVDAAILNLEAAMNLMYTYYIETSDYYTANSEIIINVNEEEEMTETNVAAALADLEDAVKDDYGDANFTEKKLIAIMLDYHIDNDIHKIIVTSVTGNTLLSTDSPPRDLYEGRYFGSCDNLSPVYNTDAAEEIQKVAFGHFWETPPANVSYYWPNPVVVVHFVGYDNQNSFDDYENENDPDGVNNYLDYTVFYMADDVPNGIYEDPHCMLKSDEIPFYKNKYIDFVEAAIELASNYKFKSCDFSGEKVQFQPPNESIVLRHKLVIIVGIRCKSVSFTYPTPIG